MIFKIIAFVAAVIPIFLFVRSMFFRRPTRFNERFKEFKKQSELTVSIFLFLIGCVVIFAAGKLFGRGSERAPRALARRAQQPRGTWPTLRRKAQEFRSIKPATILSGPLANRYSPMDKPHFFRRAAARRRRNNAGRGCSDVRR